MWCLRRLTGCAVIKPPSNVCYLDTPYAMPSIHIQSDARYTHTCYAPEPFRECHQNGWIRVCFHWEIWFLILHTPLVRVWECPPCAHAVRFLMNHFLLPTRSIYFFRRRKPGEFIWCKICEKVEEMLVASYFKDISDTFFFSKLPNLYNCFLKHFCRFHSNAVKLVMICIWLSCA